MRRELGGLLDVGRGAGGDLLLAEHELFGHAAAHHDGQARGSSAPGLMESLSRSGKLHDHAERTAARNDGGLVHGVGGP